MAVGPTLAYTFQSMEDAAERRLLSIGQVRYSFLGYQNGFLVGYRVSTGYEFQLNPKLLTGIRLDFNSHSNGDINTLAAVKLGIRF